MAVDKSDFCSIKTASFLAHAVWCSSEAKGRCASSFIWYIFNAKIDNRSMAQAGLSVLMVALSRSFTLLNPFKK